MIRGYTDGACRVSNPGECSCAFVVYDDASDLPAMHSSRYLGPELHTNNFAEYSGLLDLLVWADAGKVRGIQIHTDSDLVMRQVNGLWKVKHAELQPLRDLAYALMIRGNHTLNWIRGHEQAEKLEDRIGNTLVDKMCNEVLDEKLGTNKK
jgi:ribonuclease HI